MAVVTAAGEFKLADPDRALGAGETSVRNPLRSNLDWQQRIAETAEQGGLKILERIGEGVTDVIELIFSGTGIDFTSFGNFISSFAGLTGLDMSTLGDLLSGKWLDLSNVIGRAQGIIDALVGVPGALLGDIVPGVKSIVDSVFGQLVALLGNVPIIGGFVASFAAAFMQTSTTATAAASTATVNQQKIVTFETVFGIDSPRPLWEGIDGSSESSVAFALATEVFTINATTARGGFVRCAGGIEKRTIAAAMLKAGSVTACVFDLYKLTPAGDATLILTSENVATDIPTAAPYMMVSYTIPDDRDIVPEAGDVYGVQVRMTGTGSINVAGRTMGDVVPPIGFYPRRLGFTRNPSTTPAPTTFDEPTLTSLGVVATPYIEFGAAPQDQPRSFYDNFDRSEL